MTDIHAFDHTTKHCVLVIKPWLEGGKGGHQCEGHGRERGEGGRGEREREKERRLHVNQVMETPREQEEDKNTNTLTLDTANYDNLVYMMTH